MGRGSEKKPEKAKAKGRVASSSVQPSTSYWRDLSWVEFCDWLQGRRVDAQKAVEYNDVTEITFTDGSVAALRSVKTDGRPGYSELTPGSDGHLTTPTVKVWADWSSRSPDATVGEGEVLTVKGSE